MVIVFFGELFIGVGGWLGKVDIGKVFMIGVM